VLINTYAKLAASNAPFEVVFVSADKTAEQFTEYFSTMPWLAVPFDDSRITFLNEHFDVDGIPTLVLLDPTGRVAVDDLRTVLVDDPEGAGFPWPPPTVLPLRRAMGRINTVLSFVAFTDGSPEQVDAANAALHPHAQRALDAAQGGDAKVQFATSRRAEVEGVVRLRGFLGLDTQASPLLVAIDVEHGSKAVLSAPLTPERVDAFVGAVLAGSASLEPLQGVPRSPTRSLFVAAAVVVALAAVAFAFYRSRA
jgi:nucleoredoxin